MNAALFSIKPHWAKAILDGDKRMELRTSKPPIENGAVCLLYASSPLQRVVGAFEAFEVIEANGEGELTALNAFAQMAGIPGELFDAYVGRRTRAFGIVVSRVVPCHPFKLPIQAPRSMLALDIEDPRQCGLMYVAERLRHGLGEPSPARATF